MLRVIDQLGANLALIFLIKSQILFLVLIDKLKAVNQHD